MITFFWYIGWLGGVMAVTGTIGYQICNKLVQDENNQKATKERKDISDKIGEVGKNVNDNSNKLQEGLSEIKSEISELNRNLTSVDLTEDYYATKIQLFQDTNKGRLISMTYFPHRQFKPVQFDGYSNSLNDIDKVSINTGLKKFKIPQGLKARMNFDLITNIVDYAFWGWMSSPGQFYVEMNRQTNGSNEYINKTLSKYFETNKILELNIPSDSNELLEESNSLILLPPQSKLHISNNVYTIETTKTIMSFSVSGLSGGRVQYKNSNLTKKIYEEFKIPIDNSIEKIEVNIRLNIKSKVPIEKDDQARFEYKWYKSLIQNIEKDFGKEEVQKLFLTLEASN